MRDFRCEEKLIMGIAAWTLNMLAASSSGVLYECVVSTGRESGFKEVIPVLCAIPFRFFRVRAAGE